jgi:glucokinase
MTTLGIEIGGTKLQLVAGTAQGSILERRRLQVNRASGGEGIRKEIAAHLPALIEAHKPIGIGVGFGGPVDHRTGRIACSHQIPGWHDFELGQWLRGLTGLPIAIDNDANVAALGEARHGAGRNHDPVLWINMGSGVGGGLVVHQHLYHGAIPGEAELGHLRLDKSGTLVEDRCSGWAVDKRIREAIALHPEGSLARLVGDAKQGEARFLAQALADHDPIAQAILSELADNLAFALSHAVHLFHPQIIVVGGGLSLIGTPSPPPFPGMSWNRSTPSRQSPSPGWARIPCPSAPWRSPSTPRATERTETTMPPGFPVSDPFSPWSPRVPAKSMWK